MTTRLSDAGVEPAPAELNDDVLRRATGLHKADEPTAALQLARTVWRGGGDTATRVKAGWLMCVSSFRLGELAEVIHVGEGSLQLLGPGSSQTQRFDLLALLVVSYGELARHDDAIRAVQQLRGLSTRRGPLRDYTRSRSSMAACFALMGDPWTAQRLLGQVADRLQAWPGQGRLEAKARINLAWISLQAARMARDAADPALATGMLADANAQLVRSAEIAAQQGHSRLAIFSQMHQCEYELLSGRHAAALDRVAAALAQTERLQLQAHRRRLQLIQAELLLETGQARAALALLEPLLQRLGPGHDLAARIQSFDLAARACAALGDATRGVVCMERQRALELYRATRQLQAMSRHTQARLELERWSDQALPELLELAA